MTWKEIIKAGMTKEALIEQLKNMEIPYYSEDDEAGLTMMVRDNARDIVNKLPERQLRQYLKMNDEADGGFFDKFYSELMEIQESYLNRG
tara:strand:- start:245 stop:514 length:270 start_codon:yes stop_codon:yes gene_type:complete